MWSIPHYCFKAFKGLLILNLSNALKGQLILNLQMLKYS